MLPLSLFLTWNPWGSHEHHGQGQQCFFLDAYSSISLWPLFRQTTPQIITFFLIYLTLHNMFRLSGPDHMHLLSEQNQRAQDSNFTFTLESESKICTNDSWCLIFLGKKFDKWNQVMLSKWFEDTGLKSQRTKVNQM